MRGLDIHIGKGLSKLPVVSKSTSDSDEECIELYFLGDVVCRNEFEKKLSCNFYFY